MLDLFGHQQYKALSWKQPFGTAMLLGKVETRVWDTPYRGRVLICTSLASYNEETVRNICGEKQWMRLARALKEFPETLDLEGYAIGMATLVHSRRMKITDEDSTFVKYRPDLFVHIYEDATPIKPFQWKGQLSWKDVEPEIQESIEVLAPYPKTWRGVI